MFTKGRFASASIKQRSSAKRLERNTIVPIDSVVYKENVVVTPSTLRSSIFLLSEAWGMARLAGKGHTWKLTGNFCECENVTSTSIRRTQPGGFSAFSTNPTGMYRTVAATQHLLNTTRTTSLSANQQERVLDARYQDIQDCLNLDEIFPHLCQHHLLTSTEKQELLNPMYTSNYKIHKLMMWIPRKGSNALYHFITCLRHSADGTGHQELADKLEKEARKGRQYTTKNGTSSDMH